MAAAAHRVVKPPPGRELAASACTEPPRSGTYAICIGNTRATECVEIKRPDTDYPSLVRARIPAMAGHGLVNEVQPTCYCSVTTGTIIGRRRKRRATQRPITRRIACCRT